MGDAPKSAYEIAMEKLRAQDEARGEEPRKDLTPDQKERIREAREYCHAKLAEREILYRSEIDKVEGDPEKTEEVEKGYREDRRRLETEREEKIARIRG